jgi:hypothetical protein
MTHNEKLYKNASEAITALFNDTTVSQEECKDNLKELQGYIEIMIDSLEGD